MHITSPPTFATEAREKPTTDALLRVVLIIASVGSAAIHFAYAPIHLQANAVHGSFFLAVAWFQLAWAVGAMVRRPNRAVLGLGALVNAGIIGVWVVSRTAGISGEVEAVAFPDLLATALEGIVVLGAVALIASLVPRRSIGAMASTASMSVLGLAAFALVTASLVPSLAGDHGGAGFHVDTPGAAGASTNGEDSSAAGAGASSAHHSSSATAGKTDDHHAEAAAKTPASGAAAESGTDHQVSAAVAVPYDPTKPIDLGGTPGVTAAQQAEAENEISETLQRLPRWADYKVAEAAGFRTIGDGFTGIEHFVNREFMNDDVILDPDRAESLVYSTEGGGKKLVAAMYMMKTGTPLDDVPKLGGDLMQWHIHDNLCYNAEGLVRGITNAEGKCPAGLVKPVETPMIHIWTTPHPCGPFAALEGIGGGRIKEGEERLCDTAHGSGM